MTGESPEKDLQNTAVLIEKSKKNGENGVENGNVYFLDGREHRRYIILYRVEKA